MKKKKKAEGLCDAPGCPKPKRTIGLCDAHYARKRRNKRGVYFDGPIAQGDRRGDATEAFARITVRPDTRAYFSRVAAAEGQRLITYLGGLLDRLASEGKHVRKVG